MKGNSPSTGKLEANFTAPTSISGATSPAARAIAKINPVMIAGLAIGSTIRQMVSNWVAPSANDPWRTEIGMRDKPSSVATITTGSVNTANVRADHSNPGVPKVGVGKRSA
ncbi:Uncharacterised protein [Vibrio cholerae]|nr:Uncharacterised protein [Vibrio cholerae]